MTLQGHMELRIHGTVLDPMEPKVSIVPLQSPMEIRIHVTVLDAMEPKVHCDTAGPHGILEAMVTL